MSVVADYRKIFNVEILCRYCPKLKELVLEKCPVHVPDNYDVVDHSFISHTLVKFHFLGEMASLLVHNFMMKGVATYMPQLLELEVNIQFNYKLSQSKSKVQV